MGGEAATSVMLLARLGGHPRHERRGGMSAAIGPARTVVVGGGRLAATLGFTTAIALIGLRGASFGATSSYRVCLSLSKQGPGASVSGLGIRGDFAIVATFFET